MRVVLKGDYTENGDIALYKTDNIITDRVGSTVEVSEGKVTLTADLCGIDKLYYAVAEDGIIISNKLKDFYNYPIDDNLWPIQLKRGYVPYPFTIFRGVKKALPCISMEISKGHDSGWSYNYNTRKIETFFNYTGKLDIKDFKKTFFSRMNEIKSSCRNNLVLSLSGGCDSLLLYTLFKEHINKVVHYSETLEDGRRLKNRLNEYITNIPWVTLYGDSKVNRDDIDLFFNLIDEPCFCVTGLTEFLMIKNLLKFAGNMPEFYVMDGHGADIIFQNGRYFFKEWLLEKALFNSRSGAKINKKIGTNTIWGKALDYVKSTRTRFYDLYTEHFKLSAEYDLEIFNVYHLYNKALRMDRSKFYGFIRFILYSSNEGLERVKTTATALNVKFISPFCHEGVIKLAMSLPAKYTIGYNEGKKVLRKLLQEKSAVPYSSEGFASEQLWNNVTQNQTTDYIGFYSQKWRSTYESQNKCSYTRL